MLGRMALLGATNSQDASGYDTDAQTWITAIEAADGQALETATKDAYNACVVGLKSDAQWSLLQLMVVVAGARTQAGALKPAVGPAQTAISLPTAGYNRRSGQLGDGTGYINTGLRLNQLALNNASMGLWVASAATTGVGYMGRDDTSVANTGETAIYRNSSTITGRHQTSNAFTASAANSSTGFIGMSRGSSGTLSFRAAGTTESLSYSSAGTSSSANNILVFSRDTSAASRTNGRIAFYFAGQNLNLALLSARVSTLLTAIAAIP